LQVEIILSFWVGLGMAGPELVVGDDEVGVGEGDGIDEGESETPTQ
jgi:hypothetical protein